MKILQVIYSLALGGAEKFVVDLSNELANRNNSVTLLTLRDDKNPHWSFYRTRISEKVNYINCPVKEGFNPSIIRILNSLIKKIKPDIVHCHQGILYYLLPIIPFRKKVKYFYTVHSEARKEFNSELERKIRAFYFKKHWVKAITISNNTSQSFIDCYKTDYYVQIENGSKKDERSPLFETVKEEINTLETPDKKVFIHVGRCDHPKNQDMLVNAFNRLLEKRQDLILLIIGNGFNSEKGLALQKKAKQGIYFLGPKCNVGDYYENADAFCLSSIYEGLPISLLEALSYGCVPICTPVGGVVNVIQNEITGYLSPSTNEDDYLLTLEKYLDSLDFIKKENLIEYFQNHFSIERCTQKHLEIYSEKK